MSQFPSEKEIQQRDARSLILHINCVIKFTQQMRTKDLQFVRLLKQLRRGECHYNDYELLQTRVVSPPMVHSLRQALIRVFRNEVRTHLNHRVAIHNAKQLGCAPMVFVAQDTCKGRSIEDPVRIREMLELSDTKTEHCPGLFPVVPKMSVILTQNIAIELGLTNSQSIGSIF